jgi:ribosomal protein S18 acetylase RimI-like enzyme
MESLFLQTERLFWKQLSQIEEIEGGWIIRTPENPTWNWGNLLILKNAPLAKDAEHWIDLFRTQIRPLDRGTIMTWDTGELASDAAAAFDALGFSMSTGSILTLRDLQRPLHFNSNVELIEAGRDDALWESAVQIDVDAFAAEFGGPKYEPYARKRIAHQRKMVEHGMGKWYVATIGGEMAGSLGIFSGDSFCRFQDIAVRKDFQRQGIASTMTHEVARRAREEWPALTQVIIAESNGNAQRIYRSVGFEEHSVSQALQMKPQK